MITFCAWKWKMSDGRDRFDARHVNVLRAALDRHVRIDHELVCITDDRTGIDGDVRIVPMPTDFDKSPRCRRRMQQYSRDFALKLGTWLVTIDLDVVIVGDLTPIVKRPEPIVGWKVGHAGVYSGSFLMHDAGALDGAWRKFARDPIGYPRQVQAKGVPSDQAMLNAWLATQPPIAEWTEADGFVTYYGKGYERLEHLGVGPSHPHLPTNARIVVLGSADLDVLQPGRFEWVDEHWCALDRKVAA